MTSKTRKPSVGRDLASMWGQQIAAAYGCHYLGDVSPIPHGGLFYSLEDWAEHGYADCVEFDESEGTVNVTRGTVNTATGQGMVDSLACIGVEPDDPKAANPHVQVDACRSYGYYDRDDSRTFSLKTWREERIWEKVAGWISELGSATVGKPSGTVASLADRWAVGLTSTDRGEFWGTVDSEGWIPFWDSMCDAGLEPTPFFTGEVFCGFRVRN